MENPVIQIQNLKKSFNHQEVLKGIKLEVNAGEVIGYLEWYSPLKSAILPASSSTA